MRMRSSFLRLFVVVLALGIAPEALAQEEGGDDAQMMAMMAAMAPGEHHKHLAALEGRWDARVTTGTCENGKVFRSAGDYSDATKGGVVSMRSVHRIESPDRHILEMYAKTPDGTEHKNMEIVYTRKS